MNDPQERKQALLRGFFELDRRGLIEHDWSETAETGRVNVRVKWEDIEFPSPSGPYTNICVTRGKVEL